MGSRLLTVVKDSWRLHFGATMLRFIILFVLLFMLAESEAQREVLTSQWARSEKVIKNRECNPRTSKGETQHVHNCWKYKGGKCCARREDGTEVVWNGGRAWGGVKAECGYCFKS